MSAPSLPRKVELPSPVMSASSSIIDASQMDACDLTSARFGSTVYHELVAGRSHRPSSVVTPRRRRAREEPMESDAWPEGCAETII